jgi:hypothetical protein
MPVMLAIYVDAMQIPHKKDQFFQLPLLGSDKDMDEAIKRYFDASEANILPLDSSSNGESEEIKKEEGSI